MRKKLLKLLRPVLLWYGRRFFGWNKLKILDPIRLHSRIEDIQILYGNPLSVEVEKNNGSTIHTFSLGPFHEAVLTVVDGLVFSITYWSKYPDPKSDLETALEWYSDGHDWECIEEGYWFFRRDDEIRLWCSAAPAIGVGTRDFFRLNNKP